ncbi:MAG TPA: (5-formylfuran-3-yl)methyl phosphate synthase [Burkholderiales bacterium]|nr:(5-formylfuran-3-yl)methyl phosphate synthase [Burkholderiales bacterium]
MTRLLASVADLHEARLALAGGADIIDFKDPRRGALGALPASVVAECVAILNGFRETDHSPTGAQVSPLPGRERGGGEGDKDQHFSEHPRNLGVITSATIGDLPPEPVLLAAAAAEMAATGVTYVKIGFFGRGVPGECLETLAPLARRQRLVAVLFADLDPDLGAVECLARAGFAGVMLDTAGKNGRGLRDCMAKADIARFVQSAREVGLLTGLAGSLKASDIPVLLPVAPDYLGFRGAICDGRSRTASLDSSALREVRARIARRDAAAA